MSAVTIARIDDLATHRVLLAALKAHGFHPLEGNADGLPSLPGVTGPRGLPLLVPEEEAQDASLLAEALLREMRQA